MGDFVYKSVVENFCADVFYFENIRLVVRREFFQSVQRDFDLIFFTPKKIVFFAALGDELNDVDVALALRTALNFLANRLSLSIHSFVACGVNETHYFYFNKFNDHLTRYERGGDDGLKVLDHIENELLYGPDVFTYDKMLQMYDIIMLSSCVSKGSVSEKLRRNADGRVYVYKHGLWKEASPLDTEELFPLAALGGMFGLHLFYQRNRRRAILYLFTFGLCGVGWLFDALEILFGVYKDPDGRYLVPLQNKLYGLLVLLGGAALFGVLGFAAMFLLRLLLEALSEGIFPLFEGLELDDLEFEEEF